MLGVAEKLAFGGDRCTRRKGNTPSTGISMAVYAIHVSTDSANINL
jgi:hypothetical protein